MTDSPKPHPPPPPRLSAGRRLASDPGPGCRLAELETLADGSVELRVDGIPQSRVHLDDPTNLHFPYIRHIARLIDTSARHSLLTVMHLGGGALTLARYVAATRPDSLQLVVERQRALSEELLDLLPLPAVHNIHFGYGDARTVLETMAGEPETEAAADWVVIDLWSAAVISAHVASLEFYTLAARVLTPTGTVVVNLLDGADFAYSRSQAATLGSLFAHTAVVVDQRMLENPSLGNVLVVASNAPLPFTDDTPFFGAEADPPHVWHSAALANWIADAPLTTDATATDSPSPDDPRFTDTT